MFTVVRITGSIISNLRRFRGIKKHRSMQKCMFHGCQNVFSANNESDLCAVHEKLMKSRRPRHSR